MSDSNVSVGLSRGSSSITTYNSEKASECPIALLPEELLVKILIT